MRLFITSLLFLALSAGVFAQTAPTNFVFQQQDASFTSYLEYGYGSNYSSGTQYRLFFGQDINGNTTSDDILKSFDIGSETYSPITLNNGECYDQVIVNRVSNVNVSDMDKQTLFFEKSGQSNSNVYFTSSYTSIQEAVNTRILNRGGDNVFSNSGGATLNNIERIDLIITGGVYTPDATKAGFLINERGGNDDFKLAAITSLDANGKVNGIGSLVDVQSTEWGNTGKGIVTTVFQRNGTDAEMRPDQNLTSQNVYGIFITYADLGIADNVSIHGIAVFPGDVTTSMDLLGLSNVPTNTSASSNSAGGLDLMGGGGYFGSRDIQVTDLQVVLSTTDYEPSEGDLIDLLVTASNNGPLLDSNIITEVIIPDGFTYVSISAGYEGNIIIVGNEITWTFDELLVNNSEELTIQLMTETSGDRLFTTSITGDKSDINMSNNPDNLEIPLADDENLPITWGEISGYSNDGRNHIEWTTLSEENNDYFELLKSDNGVDFYTTGSVDGNGNSLVKQSYSFQDLSTSSTVSYYKIKQVDYDGASDVSNIIVISEESNTIEPKIYPNPSSGTFTISQMNSGSRVQIINQLGQTVIEFETSTTYEKVDMSGHPKGIYVAKILSGTDYRMIKILVK